MIIDTGPLRFAVPDNVVDQSLYMFRRERVDEWTVEPLAAAPGRPMESLAKDRLGQVGASLDDLFPGATLSAPIEARTFGPDAAAGALLDIRIRRPATVFRKILAFVRAAETRAAVLSYSGLASPDDCDLAFEILSTLRCGFDPSRAPTRAGWTRRRVGGVSFDLPVDFRTPRVLSFDGPRYTLVVTQGATAAPDGSYFRPSDRLEVVDHTAASIMIGVARTTAQETTSRVRRVRAAVISGGRTLVEAVNDEHVVRKAVLASDDLGDVSLFGAGEATHGSAFDDAWNLLTSSLRLSGSVTDA
jgi:hypothetical protein